MNWLTITALSFIFLGGVGAIMLVFGQAQSSQQDKLDIINTTKNENLSLKQQLSELTDERNKLNIVLEERDSRIQDLNTKLLDKSEYIEKYLSGGDGFPYADILPLGGKAEVMMKVYNSSEFPLYSVAVQLYDNEFISSKKFKVQGQEMMEIKLADFNSARLLSFEADEISPGTYRLFDKTLPLKPCCYYMNIHTRNKNVVEKFTIIEIGGDLFSGYIVIEPSSGKVLKEFYYNNPSDEIKFQIRNKLNTITNNMEISIAS